MSRRYGTNQSIKRRKKHRHSLVLYVKRILRLIQAYMLPVNCIFCDLFNHLEKQIIE